MQACACARDLSMRMRQATSWRATIRWQAGITGKWQASSYLAISRETNWQSSTRNHYWHPGPTSFSQPSLPSFLYTLSVSLDLILTMVLSSVCASSHMFYISTFLYSSSMPIFGCGLRARVKPRK